MRKALLPLIATGLIAVAAGAADARKPPATNPAGEAALAKLLAGRAPGKPVDCIPLGFARGTQIFDGTAIVYDFGRTLYVNRPSSGASTLNSDDILVTRTWGSQLCSLDTVRTIDRGTQFPHAFVPLGQFVPYTKVTPK